MSTVPTPEPELQRFPSRLRRPLWIGLAAVTLLFASAGLSIGVPMYRQVAIIREIERLGGEVEIEPVGPQPVARWIARRGLFVLGNVRGVWLTGEQINDESLALLSSFDQLDELVIIAPNVTDDSLLRVSRMQAPRHLSVGGPNFTDAGLVHLASIRSLKSLFIASDQFTDDGISVLCRLTALECLWVEGRKVTGAGLESLAPLTNLTELRLVDTQVTQRDVDRFCATYPKIQVKLSGRSTGCRWGAPIRFVYHGEIIFDDNAP